MIVNLQGSLSHLLQICLHVSKFQATVSLSAKNMEYPYSLIVLLFYRKKNEKTRKRGKYLQAWNDSPEWMSRNSQQS